MLPTLLAAAGMTSPAPDLASRDLDGVSQWEVLTNPDARPARTSLIYNIDPCAGKGDPSSPGGYANFSAIRVGDFKYIDAKVSPADMWKPLPGVQSPRPQQRQLDDDPVTTGPWLFNVIDDPTEHNNLLATNPTKAAQLKAELDAAAKSPQMLRPFNCKGEPGAKKVDENVSCPDGVWTPWVSSSGVTGLV